MVIEEDDIINLDTKEKEYNKISYAEIEYKGYLFILNENLILDEDKTVPLSSLETFEITYNLQNDKEDFPKQNIRIGKRILIEEPIKDGYKFKCWNTEQDGSGKSYEVGSVFKEKQNTTFYAIWEAADYTVIFDATGGSVEIPNKGVKYNEQYDILPSAKRDGYKFLGWFTSANGGEQIKASSIYKTIGDSTLYAQWSLAQYTISYNPNGGTGAPSSQTKTHGQNITLSNTKPTRKYYTFLGWSTDKNATSAMYSSGANFTSNDITTLYAIWKPYPAVVLYDSGTRYYSITAFTPSSSKVQYGSDCITLYPEYNKTIIFDNVFNNNYRYLKVIARSIKNSSYGPYNYSAFFVGNVKNANNYMPTGVIKSYTIANQSMGNSVTSYTTFTLDLNSVNNSTYYVGLNNCDSEFYIKKVWLTN